jgi:hypothetical protein
MDIKKAKSSYKIQYPNTHDSLIDDVSTTNNV